MGEREVLAKHAFSVLSCLSHKIQRSCDGLIRTRCLATTLFIGLYTVFSLHFSGLFLKISIIRCIGISEEALHFYQLSDNIGN